MLPVLSLLSTFFIFRQVPEVGKVVFISESLPFCKEGSCERCFLAMQTFEAQLRISKQKKVLAWFISRKVHSNPLDYGQFSKAWEYIGEEFCRLSFLSPAGPGSTCLQDGLWRRWLTHRSFGIAVQFLWTYKLAPSGDPFPTLPEVYGEYLVEHSPLTCLVTISDDIQYIRSSAESNLSRSANFRLRMREANIYARSDVVVFLTSHDLSLARKLVRENPPEMIVWPFWPSIADSRCPSSASRRRNIVFVGPMHNSNLRSIQWFVSNVLTSRKLANHICLTIVGRRWRSELLPCNDCCIEYLGFRRYLNDVICHSLALIVPATVPSGVSTKIFLGPKYGIPTVSTVLGIQAYSGFVSLRENCSHFCHNHAPIFVADSSEEFVKYLEQIFDAYSENKVATFCSPPVEEVALSPEIFESMPRKIATSCFKKKRRSRSLSRQGMLCESGVRLKPGVELHRCKDLKFQYRAADLTVFLTLLAKDVQFLKGWVANMARQTALNAYALEVTVGTAHMYVASLVAEELRSKLSGKVKSFTILVWKKDPGLYQMWDIIVKEIASAPLLSNWNVDDRKGDDCLLRKLNVLSKYNAISAVTSQVVKVIGDDYTASSSVSARHVMYNLDSSRFLTFVDLFKLKTTSALFQVVGPRNVPHNSPMWRRSLHEKFGYFEPQFDAGCWDYSFWLKVIYNGALVYHVNEPLEIYAYRVDSHGHRFLRNSSHFLSFRSWANECDTPSTWKAYIMEISRILKKPTL
jgi:hypothetical protein